MNNMFAVPMIWRQPTSHLEDCYFCITKIEDFSRKTKDKIVYPNLPSAIRPVPHSPELPVPIPPSSGEDYIIPDEHELTDSSVRPSTSDNPAYIPEHHKSPHLIRQEELNDLVMDLGWMAETLIRDCFFTSVVSEMTTKLIQTKH